MFRVTWVVALALLFAGCTDQADPQDEPTTATGPDGEETTDGFDAANFTKETEDVYGFQDLVVGAAPGSASFEGQYDVLVPARQATFQVGEDVWKLRFSSAMGCGTGSGRILVHDPTGQRVYASFGWNSVGAPAAGCAYLEEQNEEKGTSFTPGEYTVTYYVAGVMDIGLEVSATYLVPNETGAV